MDVIEKLREREQKFEQELADIKSAIKVIEQYGDQAATPSPHVPLGESGIIDFDDLQLPKKTVEKRVTVKDQIKEIITRFGGKEFTVNHVVAAMRQSGKGSDAPAFRNRVSIIVKGFSDEGFLMRTYKGAGNDPHKYKQAAKVSLVKSDD